MVIINRHGKRFTVPPHMEITIWENQKHYASFQVLSISSQLANAPEYDAKGSRTNEGKVLEEIRSRFPDVSVEPDYYANINDTEEAENEGSECEESPIKKESTIKVTNEWTKEDIVDYLVGTEVIKKDEHSAYMRKNKAELMDIANGKG